jgi:hypothetical protein
MAEDLVDFQDREGARSMAVLLQSVKWDSLRKLSEVQLTILNAHLESELQTNDVIKRELANKAAEHLKNIGG